MSLPEIFLERLERILEPSVLKAALSAFQSEVPTVFRPNLLKCNAVDLRAELENADFKLTALDYPAGTFSVPAEQRRALTEHAAWSEGRLWIQNPSSMLPPIALNVQPNEDVLDLASAPGSKTLQLAATGARLTAVEKNRGRFFKLKANLKSQGALDVETRMADGTGFWRGREESFNKILLDAPCSSEGRFRVDDPKSYAYWSPRKIREMKRVQFRLAISAIRMLKPGGVMAYSTCTFAPEENEGILDKLLSRFEGVLEILPLDLPMKNVQSGLSEWENRSFAPEIAGAARVLPDGLYEGFFLALIRKKTSIPTRSDV
jgi:16S rRNA C967 or C1407 C5-methylase (RsmB/RsmF family)